MLEARFDAALLPPTPADGEQCVDLMRRFGEKTGRCHNAVMKELREKTWSPEELSDIALMALNHYKQQQASYRGLSLDTAASRLASHIIINMYLTPFQEIIREKYKQLIAADPEMAAGVENQQMLNDTIKQASVPSKLLSNYQQLLEQRFIPPIRDALDKHLKDQSSPLVAVSSPASSAAGDGGCSLQ